MKTLINTAILAAAVLLLCISLLGLTACKTPEGPSNTVSDAIQAVRDYDTDAMALYWGSSFSDADKNDCIAKKICSGINYSIVSVSENENQATVTVTISNTDMSALTTDLMAELCPTLSDDAFRPAESWLDSDSLSSLAKRTMGELLCRAGNLRTEETVEISLTLQGDKWVINGDNSTAVYAMLGGIYSLNSVTADLGSQLASLRDSLLAELSIH